MKRGFTLVEVLIALGLAGILLLAGSYALGTFIRTYRTTIKKAEKIQIRQMVLTRLIREIRSAEKLEPSTREKLSLRLGGALVGYSYKDGKVRRESGASASYLTEPDEVRELYFEYPAPKLVLIYLDGQKSGGYLRNGP
jgi:prepilin-type N-terminal cleavage/methylation domain-containing protein